MTNSTEGDNAVLNLGFLVSELISFTVGLVIHSFIIGVNVSDWWRGRSVSPIDHIVMSLGIARLCTQCTAAVQYTQVSLYSPVNRLLMRIAFVFFVYSNIWLTTLLSIVYCLKISNFHARLFVYLKRMMLQRTGYLIGASLLLSSINSLMAIILPIMENNKDGKNKTTTDNVTSCINIHAIYNYSIADFFPLLFYSISSVLLFVSSYYHTTRMKMSSDLSINLETYYSVMRFVSFTFIYNTVYFIVDFICFFSVNFFCVTLTWLYIVFDFLPILHSCFLIYRTAKLRHQMSKVLQNVMDFLLLKRDIETKEEVRNM